MPTSLTQPVIDDPNFTFEQFVWLSTRQMMVAILLRDAPWRVPTEADIEAAIGEHEVQHHQASLHEARAELLAMEGRSGVDWTSEVTAYHTRATAENAAMVARYAEKRARVAKMLQQVQAWQPPTDDHASFKAEMVRQLQAETYEAPEAPKMIDVAAYRDEMLAGARRRVEWRVQDLNNATQRVNGRRAWFDALKASVPLP